MEEQDLSVDKAADTGGSPAKLGAEVKLILPSSVCVKQCCVQAFFGNRSIWSAIEGKEHFFPSIISCSAPVPKGQKTHAERGSHPSRPFRAPSQPWVPARGGADRRRRRRRGRRRRAPDETGARTRPLPALPSAARRTPSLPSPGSLSPPRTHLAFRGREQHF